MLRTRVDWSISLAPFIEDKQKYGLCWLYHWGAKDGRAEGVGEVLEDGREAVVFVQAGQCAGG